MTEAMLPFENALLPVLRRHFPNSFKRDIDVEVSRIALAVLLDGKSDFSQKRHETMARDITTLQKLSLLLHEVDELVGTLHPETQNRFLKVRLEHNSLATLPADRAHFWEEFQKEIVGMARNFQVAEEVLQSLGPWVSRPKGRPRADIAVMVAWMTGIAFYYLAKTQPTLFNDPITNEARGPFLELVADVFDALGINHSPQANAKRAVIAVREKKHPITGGYSPFPR